MPLDHTDGRENGALLTQYEGSRANSMKLAGYFSPEDWMLQSMEEASPIKWNLAHTSWFYETFVLKPLLAGYRSYHPLFNYLFNSYYQQVGDMQPRPTRGILSRPSAEDVVAYREHVDAGMRRLIEGATGDEIRALRLLIDMGCAHEEQHQELLLTDIKHAFSKNPTAPAVFRDRPRGASEGSGVDWISFEGGLVEIGADGGSFAFDNEGPRHKVYLASYGLADRPVTNAEYIAFIEAGGYDEPSIWLADGWAAVQSEGWRAPIYWRRRDGVWREYTLFGERDLDPAAPVCHLSYYEASAYAEWTSYRLPTEFEWEHASAALPVEGDFLRNAEFAAPAPAAGPGLQAMFGGVWEWTASPYVAYPGYRTPEGAIGEYNGKFMSSQMVLRGGSCATPEGHMRRTYRNFFPPHARWQFAGLRLARDV